jgi:hypothetical protein
MQELRRQSGGLLSSFSQYKNCDGSGVLKDGSKGGLLVKRVGKLFHQAALTVLGNLFVFVSVCITAYAQSDEGPSRTQCKQWDDSYLFIFNFFLIISLLLPLALNTLFPPVLGRRFWFLTSPRLRLIFMSLFAAIILSAAFVAIPFVIGFGTFIFAGVDQAYFGCEATKFGATGLLFGLVGSGVAAISQWPVVLALLMSASIVGGLVAFAVSEILVTRVGLPSRVRGIGA